MKPKANSAQADAATTPPAGGVPCQCGSHPLPPAKEPEAGSVSGIRAADLTEFEVSPIRDGVRIWLRHDDGGDILLHCDRVAVAAFLEMADCKLKAANQVKLRFDYYQHNTDMCWTRNVDAATERLFVMPFDLQLVHKKSIFYLHLIDCAPHSDAFVKLWLDVTRFRALVWELREHFSLHNQLGNVPFFVR